MRAIVVAAAILVAWAGAAWSATQTVTLSVPDMTCSACPLTIKAALNRVSGVTKIDASLEKKEAVVTFDDDKTNVSALIQATTNAGYPSTVKQGQRGDQ